MKNFTLRLSLRPFAPALAAALAFTLAACILPEDEDAGAEAPQVAYAETYLDTVGVSVSHAPTLGGGAVTGFVVQPALPVGLSLDAKTGMIAGIPEVARALDEYRVIATGPGGSDTTYVSLRVVDTSSAAQSSVVALALHLQASPAYTLARLVVEFTSSVATDPVVRDTIVAGTQGFVGSSSSDQSVSKVYLLKPLRDWRMRARVLDANDSLIYADSAQALALKVGETRSVTANLKGLYRTYLGRFSLPDSLKASGTAQTQVLNVRRLQILLNGVSVADSARSYFAPGTPAHSLRVPYVRAQGSHKLEVRVFADLAGWALDKPAFRDTLVVTPSADTSYNPSLAYTGPGSPSDPNYNPSNPGGTKAPLIFVFQAYNQVTIDPPVGGGPILFKRKP